MVSPRCAYAWPIARFTERPRSVSRETAHIAVEAALTGTDGVDRVIHLRTMHLGPDELLVGAKISMPADLEFPEVAAAIDAAEERVRAAVPSARVIYLEPDLDGAPAAAP